MVDEHPEVREETFVLDDGTLGAEERDLNALFTIGKTRDLKRATLGRFRTRVFRQERELVGLLESIGVATSPENATDIVGRLDGQSFKYGAPWTWNDYLRFRKIEMEHGRPVTYQITATER